MKKNKIVVLAGMALLMVGTILNVHDALNEFGVMEISLHPQVMAQTGTTSGTTTNMGKQLETDVKCTKTTTTSSSSSVTTGTRTDTNINGGIGGDHSWGSNSSSGSSTTTTETVVQEFNAKKYYCGPATNYVEVCSITDPCRQ